jgi:imidazolonepropionase-like amidohydrolase
MRRAIGAVLAAVLSMAAAATTARGQDQPIAFVGARVLPIVTDGKDAAPIEGGVVVVHKGKIVSVGALAVTTLPAGITTVDVSGKVLMPGLVDTHNHIGGVGGADQAATIQPAVRVYDSVNPLDSGFRRAQAGGLTTLNLMPGSGHLLSGQTVYVKTRNERTIEAMMIRDASGEPTGGIKMANGTNPMRAAPFAGTRGKAAAMVREQFIRAQEYQGKIARANGDPEKMPARDLALEQLVLAMEGKKIIHHHTHRADDIATVLRLQREFGFRVVLHHVSEAYKIPEEIAAAQKTGPNGRREGVVGCSVILVDSPGGKLEARDMAYENAGVLVRGGVHVCLHTDDWITDSRLWFRMAGLAVRAGLDRAAALKALTIEGAMCMDLGDRVGSLEPGKDADLIVLSGDPLSVYTKVEQTWVEGVKVFDRSNPDDRLYAEGGFGAGRDQAPYFCCFGDQGGWVWRSQVQQQQGQ